jgi:phage protein D
MTVMQTEVAAAEAKIDGVPLEREALENLLEITLEQNLMLPDAFTLRLADPEVRFVDSKSFEIGKSVTLSFSSPEDRQLKPLFDGEITALEPEFTQEGIMLTIRGYDRSHRLNRVRKADTFQQMSASDIARKIASANGLSAQVTPTGPRPKFTQQNNETDWEFLWRLAGLYDYEVVVEGRKLFFRPAGGADAATVRLDWARSRPMLISLRPRVTAVQQIADVKVRGWDPAGKKPIISTASVDSIASRIGIDRSQIVRAFGGGTLTFADAPVTTKEEADKLASSLASQLAHASFEAEGVCEGDTRVAPGAKLSVSGIGTRFAGDYLVSKVTHSFKGGGGYFSRFVVSGRSPRTLLDLMTGGKRSRWSDSLVVGIVTNNTDPDGLGRVRVKYPALDDGLEGWWARIAAVGSGNQRGQLMTPLVGDEVLIGFEGGDAHKPYVLGTLWNGRDKPGPLVHEDGSYHLRSDKQITMEAVENVTIKTDKDMTVEVKGKADEKVDKDLTVKVGQNENITVSQKFTLEAGTELELKCGQATIKLTKMGSIEIKGAMVNLQGSGPVTIKGATVAIN